MNSTYTFTPGSWRAVSTGNHQGLIISTSGANIAVAYDNRDANIIAAAPDLLAALIDALKIIDAHRQVSGGYGDITAMNARAAIAKALGE